jgi:hypothetical protein
MFDFEADKFEKSEQFDVILKMRKWDEQGKDSEVETPPLHHDNFIKFNQMEYVMIFICIYFVDLRFGNFLCFC